LHVEQLVATDLDDLQIHNAGGFAHQVLDILPVQVFVKDAQERRYLYLNAAARELMAYPQKNPIGQRDTEVVDDPAELALYSREDTETMETRQKRHVREPWTATDGTFRMNETVRYPILRADDLEGSAMAVISVAQDITYKEQRKLAEAIVDMLVHDWVGTALKVLLRRVRGALEGIKREAGPMSAQADRLLHLAGESDDLETNGASEIGESMRQLALTEFIPLDFMTAYIRHLNWYYVSIKSELLDVEPLKPRGVVFEYMNEFFRVESGAELIDFERVPDGGSLAADRDMLRILTYQQVQNHRKHRENDAKLCVLLVEEEGQDVIVFRSHGNPIPSADVDNLSKPGFTTAKQSRWNEVGKTFGPGLGWGLYFCRRIVEAHGGKWEAKKDYRYRDDCNEFYYRFPRVGG